MASMNEGSNSAQAEKDKATISSIIGYLNVQGYTGDERNRLLRVMLEQSSLEVMMRHATNSTTLPHDHIAQRSRVDFWRGTGASASPDQAPADTSGIHSFAVCPNAAEDEMCKSTFEEILVRHQCTDVQSRNEILRLWVGSTPKPLEWQHNLEDPEIMRFMKNRFATYPRGDSRIPQKWTFVLETMHNYFAKNRFTRQDRARLMREVLWNPLSTVSGNLSAEEKKAQRYEKTLKTIEHYIKTLNYDGEHYDRLIRLILGVEGDTISKDPVQAAKDQRSLKLVNAHIKKTGYKGQSLDHLMNIWRASYEAIIDGSQGVSQSAGQDEGAFTHLQATEQVPLSDKATTVSGSVTGLINVAESYLVSPGARQQDGASSHSTAPQHDTSTIIDKPQIEGSVENTGDTLVIPSDEVSVNRKRAFPSEGDSNSTLKKPKRYKIGVPQAYVNDWRCGKCWNMNSEFHRRCRFYLESDRAKTFIVSKEELCFTNIRGSEGMEEAWIGLSDEEPEMPEPGQERKKCDGIRAKDTVWVKPKDSGINHYRPVGGEQGTWYCEGSDVESPCDTWNPRGSDCTKCGGSIHHRSFEVPWGGQNGTHRIGTHPDGLPLMR